MRYFLDFDRAILGKAPDIYFDYVERIRREYRVIPSFIFRCARKKFLHRLLKSENVYHTENCRAMYEGRTRRMY